MAVSIREVVVVVVVVVTLSRINESVATVQTPVTLEWNKTPGGKHKVVHASYIVADAVFASVGEISKV